ncbi:MAG: hypothetical protein AB3N33_09820 [Puniceicoccaceae bacterium]
MPSRKFREPGPILYGRYACTHGEWLELTGEAVPEAAYAEGYLPYARLSKANQHLFYMGRSLRVDLARYRMDKKRRYDHRRWQEFGLRRLHLDKTGFLARYGDRAATEARSWMQARFGVPYLDGAEFRHVLEKPFLQDVLVWEWNEALMAFGLIVKGTWGAHYWFAFYAPETNGTTPPGHGYMGDFLQWAAEAGLPYAYLGTSYGLKSRYKSRGLAGIEFWDGTDWIQDRDHLAGLLQEDDAGLGNGEPVQSSATEVPHNSLV